MVAVDHDATRFVEQPFDADALAGTIAAALASVSAASSPRVYVGVTVTVTVETLLSGPGPRWPIKLSPRQQSVVDLLNFDKPVKAEVVAMRLGRKTVRAALADLCRFNVIRRVPGGGYVRVQTCAAKLGDGNDHST